MGSFNIACAATNLPILYRDECVFIRVSPFTKFDGRSVENAQIRPTHYPTSFAYTGPYIDYGNVEINDGEELDVLDGNFMVMHKFAWDTAKHYCDKGLAQEAEVFKDAPFYIGLKKEIENSYAVLKNLEKEHYNTGQIQRFIDIALYKLFDCGEGWGQYSNFWKGVARVSEDPVEVHKKWKEMNHVMMYLNHVYHVMIRPSRYAGQEYDSKSWEAMIKGMEEHRKKSAWGDDDI